MADSVNDDPVDADAISELVVDVKTLARDDCVLDTPVPRDELIAVGLTMGVSEDVVNSCPLSDDVVLDDEWSVVVVKSKNKTKNIQKYRYSNLAGNYNNNIELLNIYIQILVF